MQRVMTTIDVTVHHKRLENSSNYNPFKPLKWLHSSSDCTIPCGTWHQVQRVPLCVHRASAVPVHKHNYLWFIQSGHTTVHAWNCILCRRRRRRWLRKCLINNWTVFSAAPHTQFLPGMPLCSASQFAPATSHQNHLYHKTWYTIFLKFPSGIFIFSLLVLSIYSVYLVRLQPWKKKKLVCIKS